MYVPVVGAAAAAKHIDVREALDEIGIELAKLLRVADIDWIEAADDLVRLHVGKTVHDHRATMTQIEQRLPPSKFIRIHRSTIVNIERIREFQPWFQGDWILVLADGTRLQSGKSYRRRIRELMDS